MMNYEKPLDGNGLVLVKQYIRQWLLGKQDKLTGKPGQVAGFGQDGELTAQDPAGGGEGIPSGCILIWSGAQGDIPDGWALCNGSNGTPDLRDRFVIGAGSSYQKGASGGAASVKLTTSNMPSHTHTLGSHTHAMNHAHDASGTFIMEGGTTLIGIGSTGYPPRAGTKASASATAAVTVKISEYSGSTGAAAGNTGSTGSGTAFSNLPPYYALCYIMKL